MYGADTLERFRDVCSLLEPRFIARFSEVAATAPCPRFAFEMNPVPWGPRRRDRGGRAARHRVASQTLRLRSPPPSS